MQTWSGSILAKLSKTSPDAVRICATRRCNLFTRRVHHARGQTRVALVARRRIGARKLALVTQLLRRRITRIPPPHSSSASSSMSQPSHANVSPLRHSASSSTHCNQSAYCVEHPRSSAFDVVVSTSAMQSSRCSCEHPSHPHLISQISSALTPQPLANVPAPSAIADQAPSHLHGLALAHRRGCFSSRIDTTCSLMGHHRTMSTNPMSYNQSRS
jgi:hypothetical protein